jgi:hypothetical protein
MEDGTQRCSSITLPKEIDRSFGPDGRPADLTGATTCVLGIR